MKTLRDILILVAVITALFVIWLKAPGRIVTKTEYLPADTVIIRDTVQDTVLVPRKVYITRIDTIYLDSPDDTVKVEALIPIERKVYQTANYKATVEGYKPSLVDMQIDQQTQYITKPEIHYEKNRPRWGIGIQAGYGITDRGLSPYLGIGVQYNIFSW